MNDISSIFISLNAICLMCQNRLYIHLTVSSCLLNWSKNIILTLFITLLNKWFIMILIIKNLKSISLKIQIEIPCENSNYIDPILNPSTLNITYMNCLNKQNKKSEVK